MLKTSCFRRAQAIRSDRTFSACALSAAACALGGCTMPPTVTVIPAASARVAFQSPCAQNVIECTSSWPTAVARVEPQNGQTVTVTDTGFLVESPGHTGAGVLLVGDGSTRGNGATSLTYQWTSNATQDDPCELTPGVPFAETARPLVYLAPGFHYIRLTVENDIIRDVVESAACGVFGTDIPSFDFVEIEVEVRN